MMGEFLRRLRYYFRRREFEAELEEEMQHHTALSGRKQFGNVTRVKEESRAMWGWVWLEQLGQDVRYAVRSMFQNRVFTALAILSLALGIGANTAIYSFLDSILLRSLPVREPESLVTLNWTAPPPRETGKGRAPVEPPVVRLSFVGSLASYSDPHDGRMAANFPYAAFEMFQREGSPFQTVFAYLNTRLSVLVNGQTDTVTSTYVSGEYFSGLGVVPAAGRLVDPRDDRPGASPVAVLSYRYWVDHFGSEAEVAGQTLHVGDTPVTIVGVAPPEFFGIDKAEFPDLFLPLHSNLALNPAPMRRIPGWYTDPHFYWLEMMARLQSGVTMAQAQAAMAPRFHEFVDSTAENDEQRVVLPALLLKEGAAGLDVLRRQYSQPLYVLMTLVGLILAIACANLSSLLLARATARSREMAVRLSMGASRWRIIRQLLTESMLLASIGGALGVGLAMGGIRALTFLLANGREGFTLRAELNWHVLGVTAGLAILTGVLFGLAPALRSTRVDVMPALKIVRGEPAGGIRRGWLRASLGQTLIAGQIAASLLLLVAAGLFVRSLSNLETMQLGFNKENVLLFGVNPQQAGLPPPERARLFANLRERMAGVPGVRAASYSGQSLIGGGSMSMGVTLPGKETDDRAWGLYVGPSFFETMQIPLLEGRAVNERDGPGAPRVAVVNELFAKTYFDGSAMGRRFRASDGPDPIEIVGIAANAHYYSLKQDLEPTIYLAEAQAGRPPMQVTYEVRTAGDPLGQANTMHQLIRQMDERIAVTQFRTQAAQIDRTINQEIVFAELCSAFALLALAIAGVGLYGVTAYRVARRTGEIGIRMALGAQRGRVMWMVVREVAVLCAIGLAIGVPAALAASRFVASYLFRMQPNDPLTIAGAVAVLMFAALVAAYAPARRASRIDPMAALRHE